MVRTGCSDVGGSGCSCYTGHVRADASGL